MKLKCTKCEQKKDVKNFRERKSLKRGYQSWCKSCECEANKERYRKNNINRIAISRKKVTKSDQQIKFEARERMLKHRYDISYEEYKSMYEEQGKKCAICEEHRELGGYNGLYVDHCHDTGKVRGLLCPRCNSLLGRFMEDFDLLRRAYKYLNNIT